MKKNRIVAALLSFFLGHWGVHKFYLGQTNVGIVYVCLSFVFISSILGFIDFITLVSMSDQAFDQKYNNILPNTENNYVFTPQTPKESTKDKIKSLEGLKKLYDQEIITAEEYEEKRQNILDTFPHNNSSLKTTDKNKKKTKIKEKVDINNCSKNDLVYKLRLPIIYANDIDSLRNEGYIFTAIDELEYIVGIPPHYVRKIANLVIFSLDYKKEAEYSWRKLNSLSVEELMTFNLSLDHAQIIVKERNQRGKYKSLLEVKKRTGIPLEIYNHLV